jgi:demethoxyubiquinone hydroxylase (CLK1/Coq7/Cat5 family)
MALLDLVVPTVMILRLRLGPSPRLRSLIHTQRPTPSSAYLDPTRNSDASTSSTPHDLSASQRRVLEAALRVDQAGEVAANYIYAGQLAVLRRDPAAAALIQASTCAQYFPLVTT